MATLSKLTPGQIVYTIQSEGMGNTTRSRRACFEVKIVEIDVEKRRVLASWNGNSPTWWGERTIKHWRVKRPEPKGRVLGLLTY